jgi:hypothetical protein
VEVEPEPEPEPTPEPDPFATRTEGEDDFDAMFGATIQGRRPEDAAVRDGVTPQVAPPPALVTPPPSGVPSPAPAAPTPPAPPATPPSVVDGDHDGRTVTVAQMREMRQRQSPPQAPPPSVEARLVLSTGEAFAVDRPVLIGRAPRSTQASSAALPRIVVVDDPYVSSTHLEVVVSGSSVLATDRSTNGTLLTRPGGTPVRLAKGEPTLVSEGCRLSLSDDLSVLVEVRS